MEISKFLGKVLGIYLIIVSLALLVNMEQFASNVNGLLSNSPLMFTTGFFTVILGVLMVVAHNIWQWNWRVIITIIGWIALLKGLSILFYPAWINQTSTLFIQNTTVAYIAGAIDLVLGLVLCYFGFRKET